MKIFKPLNASAVLAAVVCATAAQADVTAAEVWQGWKDYYTQLGQTITAASENMDGDTLVVSDVKFASEMPQGSSEGSIAEVRLQEMGDGTVAVTMSNEIPVVLHSKPTEGEATDAKMTFAHSGMEMLVSGTPESMDYDYSAPEISVAMDEIAVDGSNAPVKMKLTFKGNSGKYHVESTGDRAIVSDIKADSLDLALAGAEPDGGGTFNLAGTVNGLAGQGTMNLPEGVDMKDINAAMQAGMKIDGNLAFADGAYKIEATGPDGDFTADSAGAAGSMRFSMSKDGIAYGGDNGESKMTLTGASMPFPVEATIAQSAFNLAMPVSKSETAMPAAFLVKLVDLKVSDALWNMIDPGTQLPRDPATLIIDISGAVRPLIDLFDPKQTEALAASAADPAASPSPFEVSEAKINQLQIKAVGAELTGSGAVSFDNTSATPKPLGVIELSLTGANKLMDALVAMGLVPEDQIMGARMMMGMFAVPSGEDALTSKIEFKEDGSILANGQTIQPAP